MRTTSIETLIRRAEQRRKMGPGAYELTDAQADRLARRMGYNVLQPAHIAYQGVCGEERRRLRKDRQRTIADRRATLREIVAREHPEIDKGLIQMRGELQREG